MDISLTQIVAYAVMIGVVIALVFAYQRYLARNAERRMLGMLVSVGLDPDTVLRDDLDTIMKEVRQRCNSCQSEDVCERWLKGDEGGGNAFCPNSKVFEILARHTGRFKIRGQ